MSRRLAATASIGLLLSAFCIPACLSLFASISTNREVFGEPAMFVVWLSFSPECGRVFREAQITPAFFLYLLVPALGGFLAGRTWPRRRSPSVSINSA